MKTSEDAKRPDVHDMKILERPITQKGENQFQA